MSESDMTDDMYGGPGPEDRANAAAALGAALREFGATEAQAAAGLRACLPTPSDQGPFADVRRARAIALAAAEAATRAALLLEAGAIVAEEGGAAALAAAASRLGVAPASLAPAIRAAALALPTDDASARIAAAIRAQELAVLLTQPA